VHRAVLPQPAPDPRVGLGPAWELTRTFGVGCGNVPIGAAGPDPDSSHIPLAHTPWQHSGGITHPVRLLLYRHLCGSTKACSSDISSSPAPISSHLHLKHPLRLYRCEHPPLNMTPKPCIVNMVASTRFCSAIDLNQVSLDLKIDYEQEQFPGMVYKVKTPKVCVLLFRSGKAVATGATSIGDVETAFDILRDDLVDNAKLTLWDKTDCEAILQNVVVTVDTEMLLNLNDLSITLPFAKTEYEPEQFPGLIYRIDENDMTAVCLVFSSGKCVITGCKTISQTQEAANILIHDLSEAKDAELDNF
jgi:transcription initiation factor TFIID TATA-box-binding protein